MASIRPNLPSKAERSPIVVGICFPIFLLIGICLIHCFQQMPHVPKEKVLLLHISLFQGYVFNIYDCINITV